jgi:hypothetical protein
MLVEYTIPCDVTEGAELWKARENELRIKDSGVWIKSIGSFQLFSFWIIA